MFLSSPSSLGYIPKKIVSLVPSQTLLLSDLGLEMETVGITKFCVHPERWFRSKTRVGGTKNIHREIIDKLQPDLIIANYEENVKEQVESLAEQYPVWVSDVHDLTSALKMIADIGTLTGKEKEAAGICNKITAGFNVLKRYVDSKALSASRTAYLIWKGPYMAAGGDTFINDMLQHCGLENIFGNRLRYPAITIDELKNNSCELLLLSSEPYPFKEKHIAELQAHLPQVKIMLVDGEMFSWYGSGLVEAPAYFEKLLEGLKVDG